MCVQIKVAEVVVVAWLVGRIVLAEADQRMFKDGQSKSQEHSRVSEDVKAINKY